MFTAQIAPIPNNDYFIREALRNRSTKEIIRALHVIKCKKPKLLKDDYIYRPILNNFEVFKFYVDEKLFIPLCYCNASNNLKWMEYLFANIEECDKEELVDHLVMNKRDHALYRAIELDFPMSLKAKVYALKNNFILPAQFEQLEHRLTKLEERVPLEEGQVEGQ
jgi:hypothetical protein